MTFLEYVNLFCGTSSSVADKVIVSVSSTITDFAPIVARTGGMLTSPTVTVMVSESDIGGEPLSVALMVIWYVFGPCCSVGVQLKTPVEGLMAAPVGGLFNE